MVRPRTCSTVAIISFDSPDVENIIPAWKKKNPEFNLPEYPG